MTGQLVVVIDIICCDLIIYLNSQPSFNRTTILKLIAELAPPTKYDIQLYNKKPHNGPVTKWHLKIARYFYDCYYEENSMITSQLRKIYNLQV